ncbi:MAG: hypothetical protein V1977_05230 [Candidatus Diapherotrites archaeon]
MKGELPKQPVVAVESASAAKKTTKKAKTSTVRENFNSKTPFPAVLMANPNLNAGGYKKEKKFGKKGTAGKGSPPGNVK